MQFIEPKDFILSPLYLLLIYAVAYHKRNNKYAPGNPLRAYYIPALTVKLAGAALLGIIYQYYYGIGGDTGSYFYNARLVSRYFSTDFSTFIDLVFKPVHSTLQIRNHIPWNDAVFGFHEANYFPIRILAVLQLVTFSSYLPCAFIFAALSFTGIWKAYTAFVNLYPALYKQFATAFLFMPSVFFWGSGILKDTLVMAALCWLFYGSYRLFILRVKIAGSAVITVISTFVIIIMKPYIAYAFLPSLVFWFFFHHRNRIRSSFLRTIALPFTLLSICAVSYFIITAISENAERFDINNIVKQAETFNINNREAGSAINIGVRPGMTRLALLKIAPAAVVTTLFRPFLFEVTNPLMLLSALEATFLIYLSLLALFRVGIPAIFRIIAGTPLVSFCLVFSIFFAFAIGFSTSNLGTLVRYKIPCIPFFMVALFIILYKREEWRSAGAGNKNSG